MLNISKTLVAAFFALLVCSIAVAHTDGIYNPAANSVGNFEGIDSNAVTTVANTMSLDGSASNNSAATTTVVTLSTTKTNNVIVVIASVNSGPVSAVSGSTLGAFTLRSRATIGGQTIELWWKIAASVLTSEAITVTSGANFTTAFAFAINGAKTSAPFDVNISLPFTSNVTPSDPAVVSTTAVNTILLGGFKLGVGSPTAGAGFTSIAPFANGFALAEYQIVSAAQTSTNITVGTGAGGSSGSVADAIVQGP